MAATGHSIEAAVVASTLALTGTVGQWQPAHRHPHETGYHAVGRCDPGRDQTHVPGTAFGPSINTGRTDTLESLSPS